MSTIQSEHFVTALLALLDETFDHVQGYYLDRGNSLFETLATISAAEASIPVGGKCASLAAQVKHIAFYMDVTVKAVLSGQDEPVDWGEIWRTVRAVTPDEWQAVQADLRRSYNAIIDLAKNAPGWGSEYEIGGALAVLAHCAYHLGEIRQACCTLKP